MKFAKHMLVAATAVALGLPAAVFATNGYAPHGVGQKSKGMGGVGVAFPQDSLVGGINPAGMVLLGENRLDVGVEWFRPIRSADIMGVDALFGTPPGFFDGHYDGSEKKNFFIPEFGLNYMLGSDMAVGVSVFGTGGMNTDYTTPIPLFGLSEAGIDLAQLFIVPSFSMKLTPNHSVGVGLNLAYQRFKAKGLENFVPFTAINMTSPVLTNFTTNNGYSDSTGVGLRVGWIGQLTPTISVGATYQTRTYMSEFSKYKGLFAERGDFDIPSNWALGIAGKLTPKTTLALDFMRINYNEVASIGNPLLPNFALCGPASPVSSPEFCLGGDAGPGFGWQNVNVFKLGVAHELTPNLVLRAGWAHNSQPINNTETMFNMLAPGVVQDHLTLGATWSLGSSGELTFAYMHAFKKTINGSGSLAFFGIPPGVAEVDIDMYQDSLGVSYGLKF